MRSRPTIELRVSPDKARPGETIRFMVTVVGRSETPIDAVRCTFSGLESLWLGDDAKSRRLFKKGWSFGPLVLGPDERRNCTFEFQLPEGLPPAYRSSLGAVDYDLDVRVDIPWWPDAQASYRLQVEVDGSKASLVPGNFSTSPEGPRGSELVLECALESTSVEVGGVIQGSVAITNATKEKVSRLEVDLVEVIGEAGGSNYGGQPAKRFGPISIHDAAPTDGRAYPFVFRLPSDATPSFEGALVRHRWGLDVRAVTGFASSHVLSPWLQVHAHADPIDRGGSSPKRVAPVGHERRKLVWAAVARGSGLTLDAEQETMAQSFGALLMTIALEQRDAQLFSVATLEWPDLGLDLLVAERRWSDAFKSLAPMGDEAFDQRVTVRARDEAQRQALLGRDARGLLLRFERVTLDDVGAVLARPGAGYSVEALEPFVRDAVLTASALAAAIRALPAPGGLGADVEAWREFAQRHEGKFSVGDFSIRGAKYRGGETELVTRFDAAGTPTATVARAVLQAPLPSPVRVDQLPPDAQRILASVSAEVEGVKVEFDAVEATLPCPLANPARAELLWRSLQRIAQAIAPPAA